MHNVQRVSQKERLWSAEALADPAAFALTTGMLPGALGTEVGAAVVRAEPVAMSSSSTEEQLVGRKATKAPLELKSTSLFLSHESPITAVALPGWPRAEKHSRDAFCTAHGVEEEQSDVRIG